MEISNSELREMLKDARNTGFIVAFVACFCMLILGGVFGYYVYKSYDSEIMTTTQTQNIGDNNTLENVKNENETNTNDKL